MKGLRILAVLAIAALVFAPVATAYAGTEKDKPATAQSGKSTEKQVTVVSVDQDAKTITIREAGSTTPGAPGTPGTPGGSATTSNEKTVPVTGQAINKLKSLRPGQQVTVMATLNDAGEISAISDLNLEPAAGSTHQP
jgi:hypothetical protein